MELHSARLYIPPIGDVPLECHTTVYYEGKIYTRRAKVQLFFHYMIMRKAFFSPAKLLSGKECYKPSSPCYRKGNRWLLCLFCLAAREAFVVEYFFLIPENYRYSLLYALVFLIRPLNYKTPFPINCAIYYFKSVNWLDIYGDCNRLAVARAWFFVSLNLFVERLYCKLLTTAAAQQHICNIAWLE